MGWDEVDADEKRLSVSKMKTIKRCPMQYYFRYIKGIVTPPNCSLIVGTSVHHAANQNYVQKYKTKKDLKLDDMADLFKDKFKEEKRQLPWDEKGKSVKAYDNGIDMLKNYRNQISIRTMPLKTEFEFDVPILDGYRLYGFIDLIDAAYRLSDIKTTSRKYSEEQAYREKQLQLIPYFWACSKLPELKGKISKLGLDVVLVDNTQPFNFKVTTAEIKRFENTLGNISKLLKNGIFYPTDNHQTCGWCGYRSICTK